MWMDCGLFARIRVLGAGLQSLIHSREGRDRAPEEAVNKQESAPRSDRGLDAGKALAAICAA